MTKQKRVLIIENDPWLAEQYMRVLKKAGFETVVAPNVLMVMDIIDESVPDAIVLDILLTGKTAFTLLHELQSYDDTGSIPVILCTNFASELAEDSLKPYGIVRVLDKTKMHPNDLATSLAGILE